MLVNPLLAELRAGNPVFGIWNGYGVAPVVEDIVNIGLDFTLMDMQHGFWTDADLVTAMRIYNPTDTVPIARVFGPGYTELGRILDAGVMGVVVPMINSAEEAQDVISSVRYPPKGARSGGGARLYTIDPAYAPKANDEILAGIMVETVEAVDQVEKIAAVEGLDLIFIGPGDLGHSVAAAGLPREEHEKMMQRVLAAGKKNGVAVGLPLGNVSEAKERAAQGFQFLPCTSDVAILRQGMQDVLSEIREG